MFHEQVFEDSEVITVKKIKDKAVNMKRSWQAAKVIQEGSGWGITAEDNEDSPAKHVSLCFPLFPYFPVSVFLCFSVSHIQSYPEGL